MRLWQARPLAAFCALALLAPKLTADQRGWVEITEGLPQRGQWRNGFDLADFDGDGRLDLAHAPARRHLGPPKIFLGKGSGRFSLWTEAIYPELSFDYGDAAAADFNGDGHADLALACHLRGLVVLAGDGKGRFSEQASFLGDPSEDSFFSSRSLALGDIDGDGRPDIVAMGEGPRRGRGRDRAAYGVRVLLNRLPETWEWRELQPQMGRLFGDDMTLGDFDGDGQADLATASHVQGQRGVLFWGEGRGDFVPGQLGAERPASFIHAIAAADFDADGDHDLAAVFTDLQQQDAESGIDLYVSAGDRTWKQQQLPWSKKLDRPTAIGTGDPDGDGDADLIVLSETGEVAAFVNTEGRFKPGRILQSLEGGRGCRGFHVQLADLDGDGDEEIVAGFAGENCEGGGSLRVWKWTPDRR